MGSLYSTDLMTTLQTWVIAMSSSHIRSFRHTATVIALEVETALCDVAAAVDKEAEVVGRQREGDKKRKASNKGGRVREKELEGKAAEVRDRRLKLAEFIKEFIDGCAASFTKARHLIAGVCLGFSYTVTAIWTILSALNVSGH
jgi:cohesin complex subunit SA-1/2